MFTKLWTIFICQYFKLLLTINVFCFRIFLFRTCDHLSHLFVELFRSPPVYNVNSKIPHTIVWFVIIFYLQWAPIIMGEPDVVDSVIAACRKSSTKVPSIETLNSEMPLRECRKDGGRRLLKTLFNRLRLRKAASANISEPDPTFKVAYLGNVVTGWAKGKREKLVVQTKFF